MYIKKDLQQKTSAPNNCHELVELDRAEELHTFVKCWYGQHICEKSPTKEKHTKPVYIQKKKVAPK